MAARKKNITKKKTTKKSESSQMKLDDEMPQRKKIPKVEKKSSIFSDHEEIDSISNSLVDKFESSKEYQQLEVLWHAIVKNMEIRIVKLYFETLRNMLIGNFSLKENIQNRVKAFPKDMKKVHGRFIDLLSKVKTMYHQKSQRGSNQKSKTEAVKVLSSLYNGVLPLNTTINRPTITRISSSTRDEIKNCIHSTEASQKMTRSRANYKSEPMKMPKCL
ncbi:unnamed protein product [Caenorhabditis angaria]|uniref:Uncharacterized protein n=1 Tax=Caenorhabditis angaria TaxID=860376 RepID=A0A9P1MW22_9PELO|nr:unnamed protein product [Caenorhabditis angaria]